jgi:hypothetical protein
VNEFTIEEARNRTFEERLRDLDMLFDFAHTVGGPIDEEGIAEVRRRWVRLKEQLCG